MLSAISRKWWVLLIRGIIAIGLGVAAIAWPGITLITLVFVYGAFALVEGLAGIALGIRGESNGTVWWSMIALGVVGIITGVAAVAWPGLTAVVLLVIIAASAIARGVFEIGAAIALHKEIDDEWVMALSGLLSIGFGVLLFLRPGTGALAVVLLIGAYMIAIGAMSIALSLRLRKFSHAATV